MRLPHNLKKLIYQMPLPVTRWKHLLDRSLALVCLILGCGVSAQPTEPVSIPTDLIAWWTFDRSRGEEVQGLRGSYRGGLGIESGMVGDCLGFAGGSGNGWRVDDALGVSPTDFTIEAWISRFSPEEILFESDFGTILGSQGGVRLGVSQDGRLLLGRPDAGFATGAPVVTNWPGWTHVAVTLAGTTVVFYKDGIPTTTNEWTDGRRFEAPLGIGGIFPTGKDSLYARLDEVSLYARALSATEIAGIHRASFRGKRLVDAAVRFSDFPRPFRAGEEALVIVEVVSTGRQATGAFTLNLQIPSELELLKTGGIPAEDLAVREVFGVGSEVVVQLDALPPRTTNSVALTVRSRAPGVVNMTAQLQGLEAEDRNPRNNAASLSVFTQAGCVEPISGLVRRWSFDADVRDTIAGNGGTLKGDAHLGRGMVGGGLELGEISDRLELVPDTSLALHDFTCEAWLRFGDTTLSRWDGSPRQIFQSGTVFLVWFYVTADGFLGLSTGPVELLAGKRIQDQEWHHVAAMRRGTEISLYLDGQPVGTKDFGFESGTRIVPSLIGGPDSIGYPPIPTVLDELSLYDRALTGQEIAALHAAGLAVRCDRPDLAVERLGEPGQFRAEDPVPFWFRVRNQGAITSTPVEALIEVASSAQSFEWLSHELSRGAITREGNVFRWRFDELQSNEEATLRLGLGAPPGTLRAEIRLLSPAAGVVPENDRAELTHLIVGPCVSTPPELVAWWPLEDEVRDVVSGVGGPVTQSVRFGEGFRRGGLEFPASGGALLGTNSAWQLQDFSWAAWLRRHSATNAGASGWWGTLYSYGVFGPNLELQHDGTVILSRPNVGAVWASGLVRDTNWHHLAVTKEGNAVRFYLDGVLRGDGSLTGEFDFSGHAALGTVPELGNPSDLLGSLDDVMLFRNALSAQAVNRLASAGRNGLCGGDLGVMFRETVTKAFEGHSLTARLQVRNHGDEAAENPVMRLQIPPGARLIAIEPSAGRWQQAEQELAFFPGPLPVGGFADLLLSFTLPPGLHAFTAQIDEPPGFLFPANNSAAWTIEVEPLLLSITDVTASETTAAKGPIKVPVRLSHTNGVPTVVRFQVKALTAEAGADVVEESGTMILAAGETEGYLLVQILDDQLWELAETVEVRILEATGARIPNPVALVTVTSDDPSPVVSASSPRVREGDHGVTIAEIVLGLSGPAESLPLRWWILGGTANSSSDYEMNEGVLAFGSGQTNLTVQLPIRGDLDPEKDEFLVFRTSGSPPFEDYSQFRAQSVVTILDDDEDSSRAARFNWEGVPPLVREGEAFSATLRAVNEAGETEVEYQGEASLAGLPGGQQISRLLITEVNWSPGEVVLKNVTAKPLDVSGWKLLPYDALSWPAPADVLEFPVGAMVQPGGRIWAENRGSLSAAWPRLSFNRFLQWGTVGGQARAIAVILLNREGGMEDVFCAFRALPQQVVAPEPIEPTWWHGPPVGFTSLSGFVPGFVRRGWMNQRGAVDWVPRESGGLFSESNAAARYLDSDTVRVEPPLISLTNGVWSGLVTLKSFTPQVAMQAHAPAGRMGTSQPVAMAAEPDLVMAATSVSSIADLNIGAKFQWVVNNPSSRAVSGIVVTQRWNVPVTVLETNASVGWLEQGLNNSQFVWKIGSLEPGGQATLGLATRPQRQAGNGRLEVLARVTGEIIEPNLANNEALTHLELVRSCTPFPEAVVHWWRAEGTPEDQMGPERVELKEGVTYGPGRVDRGLVFPGGRSVATVADAVNLGATLGHAATFAAWVRLEPTETNDFIVLVEKARFGSEVVEPDQYHPQLGWALVVRRGQLEFLASDTDGKSQLVVASSVPELRDGVWRLLGVALNTIQQRVEVFVGGSMVANEPLLVGNLDQPVPLHFGGSAVCKTAGLWGQMDEIVFGREYWAGFVRERIATAGGRGFCLGELELLTPANQILGALGTAFDVELQLLNRGPLAVSNLEMRHFLPLNSFVSATPDIGTVQMLNGELSWQVPFLSPQAPVSLAMQLLPENTGTHWLSARLLPSYENPRVSLKDSSFGRLVIITDQDRDGMDDNWERSMNLNPDHPGDANVDTDGDGYSNRDEYLAGTEPRNMVSRLLVKVFVQGDKVIVSVPFSSAEVVYAVDATDQANGSGWRELWSERGTGSNLTMLPQFDASSAVQFFRIRADRY